MNKKIIMGDGNKVAQPAQKMVATHAKNYFMNDNYHWGDGNLVAILPSPKTIENTCEKCIKAAKRVVFVMEHETAYFGRVKYKMHIFDTLNEAKEFRDYLIRYELSQMPLCADFEYKYDEDKDVFLLISEEGWNISYFRIYQEEDDGTVASYTLSFEERKTMDKACIHDPQKGLYVQSYNNFNKYDDDE